ncbi:cytochrome p450 7b1, partial [Fusarium langsethiae]
MLFFSAPPLKETMSILSSKFSFDFNSTIMKTTHFFETSPTAYALVSLLVLLFSTYCITTIRYSLQRISNRRYQGKEPSTLPYGVPGLGSAFGLIRNPHGFFKSIVKKVDRGEPLRMRLGLDHAYLILLEV